METISPEGFDFFTPQGYDKIYREGRKVLMNILDIEVPLIAAVNGPVRLTSEYILLADIVLAAPTAVFQDKPHFELGVASGDGVHLLWQEAIGSIRGRYFIMTRQELDAQTAKDWGAVNEIVPADKLLDRAREIAEGLAKLPSLTTKYTRIAMTQKLLGVSSMKASHSGSPWRDQRRRSSENQMSDVRRLAPARRLAKAGIDLRRARPAYCRALQRPSKSSGGRVSDPFTSSMGMEAILARGRLVGQACNLTIWTRETKWHFSISVRAFPRLASCCQFPHRHCLPRSCREKGAEPSPRSNTTAPNANTC